MNAAASLWDDTYTGPRFTYGLTYRPLGYAQVPAGWIIRSDRPHPDFRFGTVDYPFRLPDDVAARAELTLLTPGGSAAALPPQGHTPGPWHKGSGNGEGCIFGPEGHRMRLESGGTTLYPICQPVKGYDAAEDEANERLIIAAPDLLVVAQDLLLLSTLSAADAEDREDVPYVPGMDDAECASRVRTRSRWEALFAQARTAVDAASRGGP